MKTSLPLLMKTSPPFVVETERLRLREWARADAAALFAMARDAETMRYVGDGRPWSGVGRAHEWLGWMEDCYRRHGFGRWAVVEKDAGRVVGSCGFWPQPLTGEIDFGYLFARECWGRGYATEGGRAALRHGFETFGFAKVVARTAPENLASRRVLEKLGFEFRGVVPYEGRGEEVASYVLAREDFEARVTRGRARGEAREGL